MEVTSKINANKAIQANPSLVNPFSSFQYCVRSFRILSKIVDIPFIRPHLYKIANFRKILREFPKNDFSKTLFTFIK
ncbi:hypothetical protein LEP1GSC050_0045 [Leptospira phage vB_LbrZ_5399-LE1]|nr:hypothetical protein LEP1GSC050_0045 [Leptospira phage vB_LbrZ_5399-LE1]AGS80876.1 hypothetical protein LEP1GSC047_0924 [Leptospira phage vB_LinZ_10-LE1]